MLSDRLWVRLFMSVSLNRLTETDKVTASVNLDLSAETSPLIKNAGLKKRFM